MDGKEQIRVWACLLALFSAAAPAQQASSPEGIPKFTARTELVTVPVVVLRRPSPWRQVAIAGTMYEHATGLTQDRFSIEEDGEPRAIASFEEVRSATTPIKKVVPPPGAYTNEVVSEGPVSMLVILLDLVNTRYEYQQAAKKKLLEYLQRDYRGDRPTMLAVLHGGGLRVLHDFTTDSQVLRKIVRGLKQRHEHDPALDNQVETEMSRAIAQQMDVTAEYALLEKEFLTEDTGFAAYQKAIQLDRLEITFAALQQLAHTLRAIRGMKSLIWVTGGIALPSSVATRDRLAWDKYETTVKLLTASGVAVYPIDAVLETLNPGFSSPQSRYSGRPGPISSRGIQLVQNFMDISHRTGGDYCLLRKDPDLCFKKAEDFDSQYYLLSYYTHSPEVARWRKIQVKVHGDDLQVRARNGYFSAGRRGDADERRKHDIAQAFVAPVESRGLPISVRWTDSGAEFLHRNALPEPSGHPELQQRRKRRFVVEIGPAAVAVDAADRNHMQLHVVAVALDKNGKVLADISQQIDLHPSAAGLERLRNNGLAYANEIDVSANTWKVRFIVRDNLSERVGSVSAPVEAQQ